MFDQPFLIIEKRMKILRYFLLVFLVSHYCSVGATAFPFKNVIIWGHKLHSHTHSYIHAAFYRAFEYQGYNTYWFDDNDTLNGFDFSSSLFITEGQVDKRIPLRDDCRYILHNCDGEKYRSLRQKGNCIMLQVYTHDCLPRSVQKLDDCIYADKNDLCIYMPWATDLLPHEIDAIKNKFRIRAPGKNKAVYFIGTIGGGTFGNDNHIDKFKRACHEHGISFMQQRNLSLEETILNTQSSLMAPAIQGDWQIEKGYIPCRIFKNISYGAIGATNSKTVRELFQRKIVYNPDCYQLFYDVRDRINTITLEEQFEIMDFVKEKHTYLNRIEHLLQFMHMIKPCF
jgi:hypothetical protein